MAGGRKEVEVAWESDSGNWIERLGNGLCSSSDKEVQFDFKILGEGS